MNLLSPETIAAVATPPGHGAVGIIRISGSRAQKTISDHFVSSRRNFTQLQPYRLHHGHFRNHFGHVLDEVLVSFMPGPGSFTGEDVVEINCHGSPVVLQSIMECLVNQGIRPAGPGEFTQRAFLNGRLDLTQAEAVAEIISATSPAGCLLAQNKLSGTLRDCLQDLKSRLEELRAQLCLAVDFPDEDIECLAPDAFLAAVSDIQIRIRSLVQNHEQNRIWNDGALCVLSGAVNAGKSSLLNLLLGRQRAIVSAQPGTTRDYIEERISLHGLSVRVVDTAGSRPDADHVEQEGLSQARLLQEQADVILLVADNSVSSHLSLANPQTELTGPYPLSKTLVVANKSDLPPAASQPAAFFTDQGYEVVHISTKTGQGVDSLLASIRARLTAGAPEPRQDSLTPNLRQSQALQQAESELDELGKEIVNQLPYDLLGVRLEAISQILAEITGDISSEAVLHNIFSHFCIGK